MGARILRNLAPLLALVALAGCTSFGPRSDPGTTPLPLDESDTATTQSFLEVAEIREDAGDWNGALGRVDKALALQPRSRTALLRRAQIVLVAADANGDVAELEDVRTILADAQGGDDAEFLLAQAWLDTAEGRDDAARAATQRASDAGPDSARVQWMAARLFRLHGDPAQALAAADRAVSTDARSHAAKRERAHARLATGAFEEALVDVGAQVRAHPDDVEARALEGEIYWRTGNFSVARRAYEAIPPERRRAADHAALGWLALREDQRDDARRFVEAGLAAHPTDPQVLDATLALDERAKRLGESITRLDEAATARPDDAAIARLRARSLAMGGHADDAAPAFGRALTLAPGDAATYDAIALWLGKAKPEDAEKRLAALGAPAAPTHLARGAVRAARGDRAGAVTAFQQAVEADPGLPLARAYLAHGLIATGQAERALALAKEAHAAQPDDPEIGWILGLAYLRRGQEEAAYETLGAAVGSYPVERASYGEVVLTLAQALDAGGKRDIARRGAAIAVAHAGDRAPVPAWKTSAKSLQARLEPKPPPKTTAQAEPAATATPPSATDAKPADAAPDAATPPQDATPATPPAANADAPAAAEPAKPEAAPATP